MLQQTSLAFACHELPLPRFRAFAQAEHPGSKKLGPRLPRPVWSVPSSKVVQSRPKSSKVVQSRPKSSKVVQSRPKSSKVVQRRLRSSKVVLSRLKSSKVVQSRPKSSKVVQSRPKSSKVVQRRSKSSKVVQSRSKSFKVVQSRAQSRAVVKGGDHLLGLVPIIGGGLTLNIFFTQIRFFSPLFSPPLSGSETVPNSPPQE